MDCRSEESTRRYFSSFLFDYLISSLVVQALWFGFAMFLGFSFRGFPASYGVQWMLSSSFVEFGLVVIFGSYGFLSWVPHYRAVALPELDKED